jgi:hypothetical protein
MILFLYFNEIKDFFSRMKHSLWFLRNLIKFETSSLFESKIRDKREKEAHYSQNNESFLCKSHIFNKMLACICTNSTTSYFFERRIVVSLFIKNHRWFSLFRQIHAYFMKILLYIGQKWPCNYFNSIHSFSSHLF